MSNYKVVTTGSLIKKDLKDAYYLPSWPSSHLPGYRFYNDKKYRVFDCPPPSKAFTHFLFPFRNVPTAGDEVPILLDHQPPWYLKRHWKKWLPAFPTADIKTIDEGLEDDVVPIVTAGAMQAIPDDKHSVDPDVLYRLQLKSCIPEIGLPCPKHFANENAVSFPCIVKVDQSWSGRGNQLAKNKNELSGILKEIREEYGWKDTIVYQEIVEGIREVPSFQFHLHKNGEVYWIGTTCGGFKGFSWCSAVVDWDKQEYYKNLVYDQFTVPIKNYLHKQGFFGLVTFETLITDHGIYLVDVNPRVGGDTPHLLLAPYMAQLGFKHSTLNLGNTINMSAKTLVENANDINNTNEGRIIILSAADVEEGKSQFEISIFAKSPENAVMLHDKLTNTCR